MMPLLLLAGSLSWRLASLPVAAPVNAAVSADYMVQDGESWKAEVLRPLDTRIGENGPGGARRVSVVVDRLALLRELPQLQEHRAISSSVTAEEVAQHPASYANALSLLLTSWRVREVYATHPELGATRWKVSAEDGGDHGPREMYSFAFDRARFEALPWDRLAFTDFPRVAPGFSYNLRFTLEMSREVDGSIAGD